MSMCNMSVSFFTGKEDDGGAYSPIIYSLKSNCMVFG